MLNVKKTLDDLNVDYKKGKHIKGYSVFEMEDIGGMITVDGSTAWFVQGNREVKIDLNHPDALKWIKAYVNDGCEGFGEVVDQTQWNDLKKALLMGGRQALEDFLGYELTDIEEKDVIESRLEEVYEQMPPEDFSDYYSVYVLQDTSHLISDVEMVNDSTGILDEQAIEDLSALYKGISADEKSLFWSVLECIGCSEEFQRAL